MGRSGSSGQCWFRVAATPKTIMSVSDGDLQRAIATAQASLVPVDEILGLVNDYLTRRPARADDDRSRRGKRRRSSWRWAP